MTIMIYNETSGAWENIVQYLSNDILTGNEEDVLGPNDTKNIKGLPRRDIVNTQYVLDFVSRYLPESDISELRAILRQSDMRIKTDYFTGSLTEYSAHCSGIAKAKLTAALGKLSAKIICFEVQHGT